MAFILLFWPDSPYHACSSSVGAESAQKRTFLGSEKDSFSGYLLKKKGNVLNVLEWLTSFLEIVLDWFSVHTILHKEGMAIKWQEVKGF